MPDSDNREAELPLLGIDFVFDMGMKKIEEQMKNIEALDLKIAVLFGFLGTVLVALLALVFVAERSVVMTLIGWPGRIFLLLGVTFTGLAIVNTFEAFWPRLYYGTPRFLDMFRWANEDSKRTKLVFLNTLLDAISGNIHRLEHKQLYARRATWWVFLEFLSFLFAIITLIARLLLSR